MTKMTKMNTCDLCGKEVAMSEPHEMIWCSSCVSDLKK